MIYAIDTPGIYWCAVCGPCLCEDCEGDEDSVMIYHAPFAHGPLMHDEPEAMQ